MSFFRYYFVFIMAAVAISTSLIACGKGMHIPGSGQTSVSALTMAGAGHTFTMVPAPELKMPFDVDCNSPSFWNNDQLYVFNSSGGQPRLSVGPDLFHLNPVGDVQYDRPSGAGRWLESIVQDDNGTLFGIYHSEIPTCGSLVETRIGAARSTDNGMNWQDMGFIVTTRTKNFDCQRALDEYSQLVGPPGFIDGNGDPHLVLDKEHRYLYVYYGTYGGDISEQGLSVARLDWADRDAPVGKFKKFYNGDFTEPGLGGGSTPIFQATVSQEDINASMFWGPSISWNSSLNLWVMVLNHSGDAMFGNKDGHYYISFSSDISNPRGWSSPLAIPGLQPGWYPLLVGLDQGQGTDKSTGKVARVFSGGVSDWEIHFDDSSAGRLTLKSNAGLYVSAINGGGNSVVADRPAAGPWETLSYQTVDGQNLATGSTINIKTMNGTYFSAGGNSSLNAASTQAGTYEQFVVSRIGGGSGIFNDGENITLQTFDKRFLCASGGTITLSKSVGANCYWQAGLGTVTVPDDAPSTQLQGQGQIGFTGSSGQFMTAEGAGGGIINDNRPDLGAWETFTYQDLTSATLQSGDQISLMTSNGHFINAGSDGSLASTSTAAGSLETFTITKLSGAGPIASGDTVSLQANTGLYLCAEEGGGRNVVANRTSVGDWESWTVILP